MRLVQLQEKCQVSGLPCFYGFLITYLIFASPKSLEISNEKLEDEKSQLYEQLHILLQQNQELLTQALTSKDVYFEQNKIYT
jgi:hypothetical protein